MILGSEAVAQLVESALDAMVAFDERHLVVLFNSAAERLFQVPAAEALGTPVHRLISGLPEVLPARRRCKAMARRRDGTLSNVELALSHAAVGGAVVHTAVLSELSAGEALDERAHTDELLRLAFDAGRVAMAITTMEGKLVELNAAFAEALASSRERLVGTDVSALWWNPDDRPKLIEALSTAGKVDGYPLSMRSHTGARVEMTCNWRVLTYRGELHIMGVGLDRTAELAAETSARESERLFNEIAGSISEVFWLIKPDMHQLIYVSPAYEKIWGRSCESLMAEPGQWLEAIHPEDQSKVRAAAARQPGGTFNLEYRVVRPDGSIRWVHDHSFIVRNAAGAPTAVGGVAEDITERRNLEHRFQQAQKLESIGRLAGGVAHDFNNLLTVFSASTQCLLEELPDGNPERDDLAREIRHALDRGTALTRQLLAFSRQQVIEPKVLDLSKVTADAEKMLRRLIGEDVELITQLSPELPQVKVDPSQLTQVLMNLCVNARDAMPTGGQLVLETSHQHVDEAHARQHVGARPGRYVRLSVTDTGEGMSPEVQARIFEPFFTTKPAGKGTGLGLAVVFGVVQQAGGHVEVVSARGAGATFHIYLPVCEEALPAPEEQPPASQGGTETVLVVEDDEAVRRVSVRTLRAAGFKVLEAGSGEQALIVVNDDGVELDLMVTDVVMPGIDGRRLAERAAQKRPGLKVLFVSGYTDDAVMHHGVMREEVAFLNKPFDPAALLKKVRQVIDARPDAKVIPITRAAQRSG